MFKMPELFEGSFITRYKRFFVDIDTPSGTVTAHNPNTGSMKTLIQPGRRVLYSKSDNPKRKLGYTLEAFDVNGAWVLSNTVMVNRIVEAAITDGEIPELAPADTVRREYPYRDGRMDFLVHAGGKQHLVEVKSVTYFDDDVCMFPDAVTSRGRHHLELLMQAESDGYAPTLLFLSKVDRRSFRCADHIDPAFCETLAEAKERGVRVLVYRTVFDRDAGTCRVVRLGDG